MGLLVYDTMCACEDVNVEAVPLDARAAQSLCHGFRHQVPKLPWTLNGFSSTCTMDGGSNGPEQPRVTGSRNSQVEHLKVGDVWQGGAGKS